jgi:hypothetical protein
MVIIMLVGLALISVGAWGIADSFAWFRGRLPALEIASWILILLGAAMILSQVPSLVEVKEHTTAKTPRVGAALRKRA